MNNPGYESPNPDMNRGDGQKCLNLPMPKGRDSGNRLTTVFEGDSHPGNERVDRGVHVTIMDSPTR